MPMPAVNPTMAASGGWAGAPTGRVPGRNSLIRRAQLRKSARWRSREGPPTTLYTRHGSLIGSRAVVARCTCHGRASRNRRDAWVKVDAVCTPQQDRNAFSYWLRASLVGSSPYGPSVSFPTLLFFAGSHLSKPPAACRGWARLVTQPKLTARACYHQLHAPDRTDGVAGAQACAHAALRGSHG
eukprot:9473160-Pyramimonas_sp.AAC.1